MKSKNVTDPEVEMQEPGGIFPALVMLFFIVLDFLPVILYGIYCFAVVVTVLFTILNHFQLI